MISPFAVLGRIFSTDGFVPRRVCGLWPDWLVWEHVAGNALVWIAYLTLPIMIWRLGMLRRAAPQFRRLQLSFALFIGLCGSGHFLDMLAFFHPLYRLSGHVLVCTGLVSVWTAWSLGRAWPALMAMKSPAELEGVITDRTAELTRVVAELERTEFIRAYLATIVQSSHDAIISKDLDGVVTTWNAGAERLFGYWAVEAVGRPITFLIPEDRLDEEPEILARMKAGETLRRFESVRRTKDGRLIDVSLSVSPIEDASGRIIGISKIVSDITEQKRAEERIKASEILYRAIGESIPFGIWICDAEGRNTYASESFLELLGITQEECSEFGWAASLHPDDAERTIAGWRECVRTEGTWDIEHRFRGTDGLWHPILARGVPARDDQGRITRWAGINLDISRLKQVEESLRRSEENFRQLADSMPQIVWTAWPDGRVDYFNERWCEFTGRPLLDGEGDEGWLSVLHPDDVQPCLDLWRRSVQTGEPYQIEYRFKKHETGEYRWHLGRALPSRDESGRVARWFGSCTDIRDERARTEELRKSEERQRLAMTAARIAHWEWDIPNDPIPLEDPPSKGHDRDDDRPFASFPEYLSVVHPDDRELVRAAAERALSPGRPYQIDYRIVLSDGSIRWLGSLGGTVFDGQGRPSRMIGVNLDITERKESEAQIRGLNETLEQRVAERTIELGHRIRLIDQAHDAILVRTEEGRITSWNQGAERIYGWTAREAVGRISQDLFRTQFPAPLSRILEELAGRGAWEGELIHDRKDGARIIVESRWVLDRQGEVDGPVLEINSNITERRASEEALRRSELALKESQRLAGVGSWEWDAITDVVTWSDELFRIAGLDPSRPTPGIAEQEAIYTPESWARLTEAQAEAVATGNSYQIELEMIGGDGSNRWIVSHGEAIRGPDDRVLRLRGTVQDVTGRKRFEEDLRAARDQAMAATQAKSEFLANMSHEIRTPMNGVLGMTDLLLDSPLNPLQRGHAETIRVSGEALLTVINDILDFSKIEAGKLVLESIEFDLRAQMEEVVDLLAPRARQKKLEILSQVDGEVPDRLVGDPVRIRQILTNLAGNAVKFTDRGEVRLGAKLLARDEGQVTLRIYVEDTGIGIPAARQADVFESFTQIDGGSSRRHGGTGLGLAICRRLVDLMGGRIGLESAEREGSTFWFEVALEKGARDPDAPAVRLDGLHVLVVVDAETNRAILQETLLSWACRPVVAGSGGEALAKLLANPDGDPFRLILLDEDMPGMDGHQTARAIKGAPRLAGVPLVLLSSRFPNEEEESDDGLWASRMMKPIRRSQLYNTLGRALAVAESPRAFPAEEGDAEAGRPALRILLAEDNEINRRVVIGMLERLGHSIESVNDGHQVLSVLDHDRHDLILMDVQMPELDGLATSAAIRERERERGAGRHIPIIALTAHAMQGDRERCLAAGMDGYLSKPLRSGPLRDVLLAYLGRDDPPATATPDGRSDLEFRSFSVEALGESCGGDPKLIGEVLGVMLRDVPERLGRLDNAVAAREGRQVSWESHGLKGSFLTVGSDALASACEELMALGNRGDFAAIEHAYSTIRDQWKGLEQEVLRHLGRLEGGHR